jgi:hypothetical protein
LDLRNLEMRNDAIALKIEFRARSQNAR